MSRLRHTNNDGLFAGLAPPRPPVTPEEQAENEAWQAYEDRFGYRPVFVSMPLPTNEQLWEAVNTGQEITENIPESAES